MLAKQLCDALATALIILYLEKEVNTYICLHTKLAALDVCLFFADTNGGFIGGIIGGSIGGAFIVGIMVAIVGVCLFISWKRSKVRTFLEYTNCVCIHYIVRLYL